jgi:uncharacterized protein YqeY
MTLLERIRSDSLAARKARGAMATFLVTLLSEAYLPGKNAGRESTDAEVQSVVEKFMKNAKSNMELGHGQAQIEIAILQTYLPQQLSDASLRVTIEMFASEGKNMGQIMSELKASFPGAYDAKRASEIAKEVLTLTNA